ncbi:MULTISPECIES: hypothetical protein [Myroides]|uniref:hypothetical protein n=1 Tax=Myroides TaxID=76831 RepID=UPI000288B133|nr:MULTISPECIES: hypothetical protein [Myroides]MBB1139019.1 hypothetical protein [Myroides sp. WP-1]MDM1035957.1 hypothetical protein [Myroides odoratimimus]MDM1060144.1 hypothetical protein [Myroides odoratimimus]
MSDITSIKLSQYSKLLDRLLNELKTDKFVNDIWQCYKQESYTIVYKELDSIDFEVLLIELRNNNFSKGVLYNIVSIIDKLNLLFEEYNTQIQSLDLYKLYHKVYISHFFDDKIKLAIEDLKHVQEREIPLEAPKNLNEVDIEYFKNELEKIRNEKFLFEKENTHLLTDYYSLFKSHISKTKGWITTYFPEERLNLDDDIFTSMQVNLLYEECILMQCFTTNDLSFEDFYLILNRRKPKTPFTQSFKQVTKFAKELKPYTDKVDKQIKDHWREFVCSELNLNVNTIKSYGHRTKLY